MAAAAGGGAEADGSGVLWILDVAGTFLRSPIDGVRQLFRNLAQLSSGHAETLRAALETIERFASASVVTDDKVTACCDILQKLFDVPLKGASGGGDTKHDVPLSRDAALIARTVMAMSDLSVISPPLDTLRIRGMRDPLDGKGTSQMRIHRSACDLAKVASDILSITNTRRPGIFQERPVDWIDHAMPLRLGLTPLVRVCLDAAEKRTTSEALRTVMSSDAFSAAMDTKSAARSRDALTRLASHLRIEGLAGAAIRRAVNQMRASGTAKAPVIGKAQLFNTTDKSRVAAYSAASVKQHLDILQLAQNGLNGPNKAQAKARLVEMADDIVKRSSVQSANRMVVARVDRDWKDAAPATSGGAAAAINAGAKPLWGSAAGDIWAPPKQSKAKELVAFSAAPSNLAGDAWFVMASVAEEAGTPWSAFIDLARLRAYINRGSAAGAAPASQFVSDVEHDAWARSLYDTRFQLDVAARTTFPALLSGQRKAVDDEIRQRYRLETDLIKSERFNRGQDSELKRRFSMAHVKYVTEQLTYYKKTFSKKAAGKPVASLLDQISALNATAAASTQGGWHSIEHLLLSGHEALCTILCMVHANAQPTPFGASLRAHAVGAGKDKLPPISPRRQTALLERVDLDLRRCVLYGAVVDRCIAHLRRILPELTVSTEQRLAVERGFVDVWLARLRIGIDAQVSWGGLPSTKASALRADTADAKRDQTLLAVPRYIVCQSGVDSHTTFADSASASVELLACTSRYPIRERLAAAREMLSESVMVQAMIGDRIRVVRLLCSKFAVAGALGLNGAGGKFDAKAETPEAVSRYTMQATVDAQSVALLAVMALCIDPNLYAHAYMTGTATHACELALTRIPATGNSPDVRPRASTVDTGELREHIIRMVQHFRPQKQKQQRLLHAFHDVRGVLLRGFLDAVDVLSDASRTVATSRLIECLSIFIHSTSVLVADVDSDKSKSKFDAYVAAKTQQLGAVRHGPADSKVPLGTWKRLARDCLMQGRIVKFSSMFKPTLDSSKLDRDTENTLFAGSAEWTSSLAILEREIWEDHLSVPPIHSVLAPLFESPAAAAAAAAAAAV